MRLGAAKLIITIAGLSHSTAMAQSFLGLSLAPRLITVAEVWQNRSAGPIVQLEGSEAYQAAFAGIARQESQERSVYTNHDIPHSHHANAAGNF